jgi:uncharacterized linocin/CFP29 family protein
MNNLHRELAPISDSAWAQIEEETSRTLKRYLAGRRVVDLKGPAGSALSAIGTGHLRTIAAPAKGVVASQREVKALVELRVPFELDRKAIDDVDRGANDSDWQPAKDAARQIAFAEDAAIFDGYTAAGIGGIRQGTSNPIVTLPADVREYPDAIAQSLSQLRLVVSTAPTPCCSAPTPTPHSPKPATTDTLCWSTSSGWSKIKSSGRPPSPAHSC